MLFGGTSGAERALNISSWEALQRESLVRVLSRDELRGTACRSGQSSIKNEDQNCVWLSSVFVSAVAAGDILYVLHVWLSGCMRYAFVVVVVLLSLIDDLRKSRGLHSVRDFGHGPVYLGPCLGVAQSRHAFVGGTVSTWGRWRIPVNKRHQKCRSNTHCSRGTCRSDSKFPQLVV